MESAARLRRNAVVLTTVFLFTDIATKLLIWKWNPIWSVIHPSVIQSVRHQNFGIIANIPLPMAATIGVTVFLSILIFVLLARSAARGEKRHVFFLSMLLAGALGNLVNRIANGFVFDWILLFERSAINFADLFVVAGLIGYFYPQRSLTRDTDT